MSPSDPHQRPETIVDMTRPPEEETYHATWTNAHAERLDYEAHRGEKIGHLRHSGISTKPVEVRDARAPGYVLDREELAFLSLCWSASALMRHMTDGDSAARREIFQTISEEPGSYVSVTLVTQRDRCRHCGLSIGRDLFGGWSHLDREHRFSFVGCRSASFDPGTGWDETLTKSWKATPLTAPHTKR